jgi:hypothetical protein
MGCGAAIASEHDLDITTHFGRLAMRSGLLRYVIRWQLEKAVCMAYTHETYRLFFFP